MFFSRYGEYEPCGLFTVDHFMLIAITLCGIFIALRNTAKKSKDEIKKIIKGITIVIWILEVIIIAFKLRSRNFRNVNNYVPLYFCSLLLYAGALSSFGKGLFERIGNVFLATGGIIGGIVFIIMPTTSLPYYPAFHLVSIHSFFFHGCMLYLGLLLNISHYITLEGKDIVGYASLVGIICILAYIVNNIFDSNLMFISKNFPNTPIEILYKISGKFFTPIMAIGQMTLPFYAIYCLQLLFRKKEKKLPEGK